MIRRALILIVLMSFSRGMVFAQNQKPAPKDTELAQAAPETKPEESKTSSQSGKLSVTHHTIKLDGEAVNYTATAGRLGTSDESGKHKSDMFFVAYTKDNREGAVKRPISFVFNGGPGASSVWLHLGAIGPKRVPLEEDGKPSLPPYHYVDNEYSWLAFTDLVFIDPVGTGFSRPAPGENISQFHGIKGDTHSVGDFVRLYVTKYDRWLSKKFLVGESYGTYRAIGLAEYLFNNYGMNFNGLVLISLAMDFQTFSFRLGNDLPYVLSLPSYTAAAWYHKRLNDDFQKQDLASVLKDAEDWAMSNYIRALAKGSSLSDEDRKEVLQKLSYYTGLSEDFIKNHNLRIDRGHFRTELLRGENRVIGSIDSRASILGQSGGFYSDPGLASTIAPYVAAMNDYLKVELRYENDLPYVFLSDEANHKWDWGSAAAGFVNLMSTLQQVMNGSPLMKIFVAGGHYDLTTPYMTAGYAVEHLGLDPLLQKNITVRYYDGGHQMYTDSSTLQRLTADVTAFERSVTSAQ